MKKVLLIALAAVGLYSCSDDTAPHYSEYGLVPIVHSYPEAQTGTASPFTLTVMKVGNYKDIVIKYELVSGSGTLQLEGRNLSSGDTFTQTYEQSNKHNFTFTPSAEGDNLLRFTMTDAQGITTEDVHITGVPDPVAVNVAMPSCVMRDKRGTSFDIALVGDPADEFLITIVSGSTHIWTDVVDDLNQSVRLNLEPGQSYRFQSGTYPFIMQNRTWDTFDTDLEFTVTDPDGAVKTFNYHLPAKDPHILK